MRRRGLAPVREEPHKRWRSVSESDLALYTLVASVGALTYANSLSGEFVHDDIPAIVSNGDVTGGASVLSMLHNDFWGTPMSDPGSHKSYRPLTTLSFRLNYLCCGLSARCWHAVNVLLHAACCALVLRAGAQLARLQRPFAALAALLFAVHPVHTEAVAGVVGRADVLACIFYLSSILLYHGVSGHRVWCSVLLAALSMLAKETGLTALLFNVGFDLYRSWPSIARYGIGATVQMDADGVRKRVARGTLALGLLVGARLALLQGSLPAFSPQDNPPAFHPSFAVRLMTFSYLAALNWWLLVCPWTLSHDWQMGSVPLVASVWDSRNLLTGAALLALLALAYRCWVDLEMHRHTPLVAGLMLLVIPYLPASNLLLTVGFVLAERVLYIPSIGWTFVYVYGLQQLWRRCTGAGRGGRRALVCGVLVLAACGAGRAQLRVRDWRNRETLLRADLLVLPHNAKLHYNFANFLKDTDLQERAITHYKEAIRLWPSYASAHNNLGTLEVASGRAEHHFLQALKYNRDHVNAHYNLAKLYRRKGRISEAIVFLRRCIALSPRWAQPLVELALLTPAAERRPLLDALLRLQPRHWQPRLLYGHWFKKRGLYPQSLQQYSAGLRLSLRSEPRTGDGPAVQAASLLLRARGQWARVLQLLTRWQMARGTGPARARRLQAERAWRLRLELASRAALYARPQPTALPPSTCLHHSYLEVSSSAQRQKHSAIDSSSRPARLHPPPMRQRPAASSTTSATSRSHSQPTINPSRTSPRANTSKRLFLFTKRRKRRTLNRTKVSFPIT